ncbi:MAG: hypothetical protein AAFX58_08875 [Pseudomonadota bacterium]
MQPLSAVALCLVLTACAAAPPFVVETVGRLGNPALHEASGLIRSGCMPGRFWALNDNDNPAELFLLDDSGNELGRVGVAAVNVDWEDLDYAFVDGVHRLVIADIGDNEAVRPYISVYFVDEPCGSLPAHGPLPAVRYDLRYPDGPRDAEGLAIDAVHDELVIVTKRTLPPAVYSLPLAALAATPASAAVLSRDGDLTTLHEPTPAELEAAPLTKLYRWQPAALALTPDAAAVLTSRNAYYYRREGGQRVFEALGAAPVVVPLPPLKDAEALSFDASGDALMLTSELEHAPVIRIRRR